MDPFLSLPPVAQAQILILLRSADDLGRLCRASPAMLRHYLVYKVFVSRTQLSDDLDDDLVQDAMAIIHFPSPRATTCDEYEAAVTLHMATWSRRELPNPLTNRTLVKLGRLFRQLHKYTSDYMAKATSPCVPRAYLCLDNVTHGLSQSRYTHMPFDLNKLTQAEKKRLFQAFLRYELFCKVDHPRPRWARVSRRTRFLALGGHRLEQWELEGIRCVHEYVRSLYGAVLAHCSGIHRPQPDVHCATQPSHWHFDADPYGADLGLPGIYSQMGPKMADCGLRRIEKLIDLATQEEGRQRATEWFERFARDVNPALERSLPLPSGLALAFDHPRSRAGDFRKSPCVCQALYATMGTEEWLDSTIEPSESALRRSVFRQRAWVLLDNPCLYPGYSPSQADFCQARLSHFPSMQDMAGYSRKGKALCAQLSRARI